jgi:neurotransmitter:Na+ symporter, NSS family
MSTERGEFSSRIGFVMAAAGSAIGLGNIWGFPGQAAQNGGAAFVVVYIILSFIVAYPVFMAELTIGRYSQSNIVGAFNIIEGGKKFKFVGYMGVLAASLIYGFYAVIAGWMLSYVFNAIFTIVGFNEIAQWCIDSSSLLRNISFMGVFGLLTMYIITGGVKNGIEKWSARLMPALIIILIAMIIYVSLQEGAMKGLAFYLSPDFSKIGDGKLILSALGQAFFSLSLGVGTMLVYGSYIRKNENLPVIGALVTLADVGIAFMAGFLIIPAMFVAQASGVEIYAADGSLIAGANIVFQVLPELFDSLGAVGPFFALIFFALMTIAALTSSISMLEVPVAYAVDDLKLNRKKATFIFGFTIMAISVVLIMYMDVLFGLVVSIATQWLQPIIGLLLCIFIGWVMNRNQVLGELKQGYPEVENSFFYKIWPWFVRVVCPVLILLIFYTTLFG